MKQTPLPNNADDDQILPIEHALSLFRFALLELRKSGVVVKYGTYEHEDIMFFDIYGVREESDMNFVLLEPKRRIEEESEIEVEKPPKKGLV